MRRLPGVLGVVLGAALLAGCGSSSTGNPVLQRDTAGLVAAARAGNPAAVQAALTKLRKDVAGEQASGTLSADHASRVLTAASTLAADVPVPKPAVPQPAATPVVRLTPKSAPAPSPKEHHKRHKHSD